MSTPPVYLGHHDQLFGPTTYAQHGDDLMIANIFHLLDIAKPSYLDLGAHHPTHISNTKLLYDRGSRGVNVEANPFLIDAFNRDRPEDKNLNFGVGLENKTALFYMYGPTSGRNTFSVAETSEMENNGLTVRDKMEVPVVTINEIVETYCNYIWPQLLSCDIEGLDFYVLESANFSGVNSPIVICVETRRHESLKMRHMLFQKGYVCFCRMGENLIFIRHDYVEGLF